MIDFKPPIFPFTIENLSKSIRTGELLPSKLTGLCLDRIEKFNHILNSFITLRSEEEIFEIAEKCDKQAKQNDEPNIRSEFDPFRQRTNNQRRGNNGKHQLKQRKQS